MIELSDDDGLAAEYVLGTLRGEERSRFEQRIKADRALMDMVEDWEARFSPLLELVPEVAPPPHIRAAIMAHLPDAHAPVEEPPSPVLALRRSVKRWRMATAALTALAACLVGWILVAPLETGNQRFVAVLQKDPGSPAIVLDVDIGARRLVVQPLSTDRPSGKSLELWLINPEVGAPRSLGVVQPDGVTHASLAPFEATAIARATYAITAEPPGGSASGAPSGPPLLSGRLVREGR